MELAFVSIAGRGGNDLFLADIAGALAARGLVLAGCVQTNIARADRNRCDMDLRVLPDGPVLRISEDRGAGARGCLLDTDALEQTVTAVTARLKGADLLIVNKFGKLEAEGRGLVPVIASALEAGIPVLVGVNTLNRDAFDQFADGLAQPLPGERGVVLDWCLARRAAHAA